MKQHQSLLLLLLHLKVGRGQEESGCQAAAATPNLDRLVSCADGLKTRLLCCADLAA